MFTKQKIFLAITFLLFPLLLFAGINKAEFIKKFNESLKIYEKTFKKGFSGNIKITMPINGHNQKIPIKFWIKNGLFKMETSMQIPNMPIPLNMTIVFDGKTFWNNINNTMVIKLDTSKLPTQFKDEILNLKSFNLNFEKNLIDKYYKDMEVTEESKNGNQFYVVSISKKVFKNAQIHTETPIHLPMIPSVSHQSFHLRRIVLRFNEKNMFPREVKMYGLKNQILMLIQFKNLSTKPIPSSTFVFIPPQNIQVMDITNKMIKMPSNEETETMSVQKENMKSPLNIPIRLLSAKTFKSKLLNRGHMITHINFSGITYEGITYGNNEFIAVVNNSGKKGFFISRNKKIWTFYPLNFSSSLEFTGIIYNNKKFIASGNYNHEIVFTSSNGKRWKEIKNNKYMSALLSRNIFPKIPQGAKLPKGATRIVYGNKKFVAISDKTFFTSSDGKNWKKQNVGKNDILNGIAYGNKKFIVVGYYYDFASYRSYGIIFISSDGEKWKKQIYRIKNSEFTEVVYKNNKFIILGNSYSNIIFTSPDCKNWKEQISEPNLSLRGIVSGNNKLIAFGYRGSILTSIDGKKWIKQSSRIMYALNGIAYGNKKFVAVGDYGLTLTSSDGKTWIQRQYLDANNSDFIGITYGNKKFVIIAQGEILAANKLGTRIFISSDGEKWKERTIANMDAGITGIAYVNNTFIVLTMTHGIFFQTNPVVSLSTVSQILKEIQLLNNHYPYPQ
jgi:outer membrane lipoprotein-sorting protein